MPDLTARMVLQLVDRPSARIVEPAAPRLPEPWAWYRGDELTGFTNGDPVTSWPDRAGGIGTAPTAGSPAPQYQDDLVNGQPGAVSTFSTGSFDVTFDPQDNDWSLLVVTGTTVGYVDLSTDSGSGNPIYLYIADNSFFIGAGSGEDDSTSVPFSPPSYGLLTLARSGGGRGYLNGLLAAEIGGGGAWPTAVDRMMFVGGVAEVAVWRRELSAADVSAVDAYVASRYGLGA